MTTMRYAPVLLSFFLLSNAYGNARSEVFLKQTDCAENMFYIRVVGSEDAAQLAEIASAAASACINQRDMAAIYMGFKRYENRNLDTIRKEYEQQKKMLIQAVLARYTSCQRDGQRKSAATRTCTDFLNRRGFVEQIERRPS